VLPAGQHHAGVNLDAPFFSWLGQPCRVPLAADRVRADVLGLEAVRHELPAAEGAVQVGVARDRGWRLLAAGDGGEVVVGQVVLVDELPGQAGCLRLRGGQQLVAPGSGRVPGETSAGMFAGSTSGWSAPDAAVAIYCALTSSCFWIGILGSPIRW